MYCNSKVFIVNLISYDNNRLAKNSNFPIGGVLNTFLHGFDKLISHS